MFTLTPVSLLFVPHTQVRGLPYRSSPAEILTFFQGYQYLPDSLQIGLDSLGRPSGEAWLTFINPQVTGVIDGGGGRPEPQLSGASGWVVPCVRLGCAARPCLMWHMLGCGYLAAVGVTW